MRKALLITIVFLLLTLSITQSAIAQRQNIITNQTTEPLYVVYSTKFGAHDAIPAGYWTAGWEKISAGQQKTLWAYDPHKIYFQIWKGYQRVKPLSSTQTLAFWINRNADFNVVTQQEINASITRGQLVHSSHDTSALTHSDGFMRYNNGSQITVTNAWVNVDADVNAGLDSVTDRQVFVWDPVEILRGHTGAINALAWHPTNSQRLVSVSSDRTVRVWLFAEGITHTRLTGHTGAVLDVAWEQDGTEFHSTSSDGTILAWSPRTGFIEVKVKKTYPIVAISLKGALRLYTTEPEETSVDLSWDAKRAVIGFTDNTIQVTTVRPYNHLHTLTGHTGSVNAVVWSPDDMRIVSGSADRTVRVWDPQTGELLKTLRGHTGSVNTVAWSPDGTRIVSGSDDGTVRIWDAETGELLETLREHTGAVNAVAWSPDGTRIASGGADNIIRLWEKPEDSDMMSDGAEEVFDEEGFDSDMSDGDAQDVSQPVNIPDVGLRSAIEEALGKTEGATISPADMRTLTELDAREQDIQDITGLEFATNLTVLNLNDNQISDVSPLDGLTELIKLFLNKNRISDVSSLAGLTNLTGLTLFYNEISDVSPLAGLTNLTGLYLGSNKISDVSSLAGLTNLIELTLSYNEISDVSPLAGLTRLTSLGIFSNEISDVSPLAGLTRLTSLGIFSNEISDVSPLAGLTRLKTLNLFSNEISDVSPLAGLTKLKWLDLSRNEISDFSPIAGLIPNLEYYSNSNQDVSQEEQPVVEDEGDDGPSDGFAEDPSQPVHIPDSNLRSAITLELGKAKGASITVAEMQTLTELVADDIRDLKGIEFATNLTGLFVLGNQISDISPLAHLKNLTQLEVNENQISDISPLAHLKNLTQLEVNGNQISDVSPLAGLTNLTRLSLIDNQISDVSPLAGLRNLTELDIGVNQISDVSPLARLTNLTELHLFSNQISDVSPLARLTNLTKLDLQSNRISDFSPTDRLKPNLVLYIKNLQQVKGDTAEDTSAGDGGADMSDGDAQDVSQPVNIPDVGLRSAIEEALGKTEGATITQTDMLTLTRLDAREQDIQDITGIEFATNLTLLNLDDNQISDVSPLAELKNLKELELDDNQISDVSPLAELKNLEELILVSNQISDISPLAELKNLTSLNLYGNQILDVSPLAELKNLTSLTLARNRIWDFSPIAGLIPNLEGYSDSNQAVSADGSVIIPDPKLRFAIEKALGKTSGATITGTEMRTLTRLDASKIGIQDITGIEFATNLTALYLNENEISDVSALIQLKELRTLWLYVNQISDIAALAQLTNLTSLSLSHNQLSDVSALADLKRLKTLWIDGNQISDIAALAQLTDMRELSLPDNQISDVSPLVELKNLTRLHLVNNHISDVSPLAGLTNLRGLYLSKNRISDFSPIAGLIPNLKDYSDSNQAVSADGSVIIPDVELRTAIEKALGKTSGATISPADMLKLTELSPVALGIQLLDGSRWGVKYLTGLEFAANLTELDLRYTEVSDVSPLAGLKNLETLFFAGTEVSDVSPLAGLTNLTVLYLANNAISDVSPLAGLTNLTRLDLGRNEISDISPLAGLKNLKTLGIGNRIADVSPLAGLKNLERLRLYKNRISDISPLAELKNLKRLDLRFNKISDVSPLAGLKNLERLDLRHNLIVDFSPIAGLISNLTEYVDKPQDIADENYWSFYTIYWPDPMYSIADLDWATDTYVICGGADTDGSGFLRNFNIHQGAIQYLTYKNDVIISVAIPQHDPSYVVYGRLRQDYASMRYIDDFSWRGRFGQDTMTAIEFANVPDAPHYLLTGGSKGVNTWDTENPQDIIHGEHWKTGGGIRALDPNALLIADGDNNVDDWDFSFGKIRAREEARQIDGFFEGIAHGFGELFAPEEKRNVVIKAVYDVHTEPVTSLSQLRYSYGNSSWFVSGSEDNTIRTWDKFNNKSISVGTAHKADVNSVDISPNGNFIASGSNDNTVCIWKCSDGDITELNSQFFADTDVLVVKFSPNGDYLAVGTKSGLYIYKNGRAVTPAPALITTSPEQTSLLHNYPNPFNPETWIPYHLSQPADVVLTIYSIDGKVVRWLDLGHQAAGYYQSKARAAYWDGRNNVGERVASGIYFYTLRVGDFAATKKLLIRK